MARYIYFLFFILLYSCKNKATNELDKNKAFNGKITYQISYPYNQDDPYLNLYPTELVAEINDSIILTKINDIGISIDTYFNLKKESVDQFVEIAIPHNKIHIYLDKTDIIKLNNTLPNYQLKPTAIKDSIGPCEITKTIAIPNNSSSSIDLWTTKDIKIKGSNFFGPFSQINETLLDFEATNLGFRMRLKATKIEPCKVEINHQDKYSDFQPMSLDSLEEIISNIFSIEK